MNKPGANWRIILRLAMAAVAAAVLVAWFLSVRAVRKGQLEMRIQEKLAAIRRAGEPVTAQDVDRQYGRLPDADNSALIYLRARSNLVEMDFTDSEATNSPLLWIEPNAPPSTPIPSETKSALEHWLWENKKTLALLHQALPVRDGRYPLNLSRGFIGSGEARLPGRQLSTLLVWDAILADENGHPDTAMTSLMSLFGLVRSLNDHPYPVGQLFREVLLFDITFAAQRIVNQGNLTEDQLRTFQDSLRAACETDWIKRSMLMERCTTIEISAGRPIPTAGSILTLRRADRTYAFWHFFLYPQRNMVDYLELMDRYLATASLPLNRRLAAELETARDAGSKRHSFSPWFPPPLNWAVFTSRYALTQARLSTTGTALAVERYRLANNGRIPSDLGDLIPRFLPSVPEGPTDGQPLQFKKLVKGYTVSTSVLCVEFKTNRLEEVTFRVER